MAEPPIRRRSGWGEMFFPEEKAFPHIRDRVPIATQRSGCDGKRQSSKMSELSPGAEARDMALAKPLMGGNVFCAACGLLFCCQDIKNTSRKNGRYLKNRITERCQHRSCRQPAPPSWWRSRTRCRTRRRPSRSCRSEQCRHQRRRWRCGNRR